MPDVYCEVCGEKLPIQGTYRATDFMSQTYFFCSIEDEEKFLADPNQFIKQDKQRFEQPTK